MILYEIRTYVTANGRAPFQVWIDSIKDTRAALIISARIERAARGDFGDWKSITGSQGCFEMRIHYSSGYRIYYTITGQKVLLLLADSTKDGQNSAVSKARQYLADYNERVK